MSIKVFSRGKGASAVRKAAYRAAERFQSEYDGETYDYTRKRGVIHKEILLPENAPKEYLNRETLWNSIELCERYKTAQLAREIEISLPVELTDEQNIALARKFANDIFVKEGMCADICVHDDKKGNPHAHIMLSLRPIEKDGKWGQKSFTVDGKKVPTVDWNDQDKSEYWRKKWAQYQNAVLKGYGININVDHRSYERQEVDKIPTVHLGPAAWMEKKGIRTELGDKNREIDQWNKELRQIRARIKKLKKWLYEQPFDSESAPSMGDVLKSISDTQRLKTRAQKIANLKNLACVINFLNENNFGSIEQLADKVAMMHQEHYDIAGALKKQERRITTLDEHLKQTATYNQTKKYHKKYTQLPPNHQTAYKNKHAAELQQYETAVKYLKDHLNGRTAIPEKAWKAEREKLLSERYNLAERYYDLKSEVKSLEIIRRNAECIITGIEPDTSRKQQISYQLS